jgi:hypothetical protein
MNSLEILWRYWLAGFAFTFGMFGALGLFLKFVEILK